MHNAEPKVKSALECLEETMVSVQDHYGLTENVNKYIS